MWSHFIVLGMLISQTTPAGDRSRVVRRSNLPSAERVHERLRGLIESPGSTRIALKRE
jgi:hypothetical protein